MSWDETLTEQEERRARGQLLGRRSRIDAAGVVTDDRSEAIARGDLLASPGTRVDGTRWSVGDRGARFPPQSISNVFTYALALEDNGRDTTLTQVGVESSGDPFNSLAFDQVNRRPHTPMVNAGALVAADILGGDGGGGDVNVEENVGRLLERVRIYAGNHDLHVDEELLAAQLADADRNLGISYYMRSLVMLVNEVEDILRVYLSACSVPRDHRGAVRDGRDARPRRRQPAHRRARAAAALRPRRHRGDVHLRHVRRRRPVGQRCGHPLRRAACPAGSWRASLQQVGLAAFSPGLDVHGNSVRGVNVFRELSERFGLHVFADPEETRLGRLGGRVWPEPEPEPEPGALGPERRDVADEPVVTA